MRLRRVVAELAQRAPLAQEIPVLVELYLQRGEAMSLLGRKLAAVEEAVLFGDQGLDMCEYGCIFVGLCHGFPRVAAHIRSRRSRSPRPPGYVARAMNFASIAAM